MKLLLIDNTLDRDCWGSEDLRRCLRGIPGISVHVRRAPHGDLPDGPEAYDRIIASGSATAALEQAPWIDRLLEFTRRSVALGKPFLGVCYGHQILARALGGVGSVRRSLTPELGWTRIELLGKSALFEGIAPVFHSFSNHFDEVGPLPQGLRSLARSEDCGVQALQLGEKPIFGLQFHPEKDLAGAEETFAKVREKKPDIRLLQPGRGKDLYDHRLAPILFRNFCAL